LGIPGFTIIDYAFSSAALTVAQASNSGRGNINSGFYSWKPLGVAKLPEGVPSWSGSPKDAAMIVRKVGRYYGASNVGFCELDQRWVYSHTSDGRPIVFEDIEEGHSDGEMVVIPESHKWVIAITVPMEVEEILYSPTALNPVSNMGRAPRTHAEYNKKRKRSPLVRNTRIFVIAVIEYDSDS
jgi:hypothetical protein